MANLSGTLTARVAGLFSESIKATARRAVAFARSASPDRAKIRDPLCSLCLCGE